MKKAWSVINKKSKGFSLIEVMLAITFFGLIITTFAGGVIFGKQSTAIAGDRQRAVFLAEEAISALQSIRQQSWNEFIYNQSAIELNNNEWILSGEGTVENIDDIFQRTINFYDVCRDENDDIADCPASYTDIDTIKAIVVVSWEIRFGVNYSVELPIYLTNWEAQEWIQSNWANGPGQDIWLNIDRYFNDDGNIDYSTSGEIKLKSKGSGDVSSNWKLKNGLSFVDTTDGDFNQGTFDNIQIVGSGQNVNLLLAKSEKWAEHQDSKIATSVNIKGMDCLTVNECWAVGGSGRFLRFNGTNWTLFKNIGTPGFNDIDMISSTDGWAVADSGWFYRYDGNDWNTFAQIGTDAIYSIHMLNTNLGWAAGANGKFYYYDGTSWAQAAKPTSRPIYSLYMLSPSEGWAVSDQGRIWYYNGTTWSEFQKLGDTIFNSIFMVSPTDGWIVGHNGLVHRFNGTAWSNYTTIGNDQLYTVFMLSSTTGWIAGTMANQGIIYKFDGISWNPEVLSGTDSQTFYTSYFPNADSGWTMGSNGSIFMYGDLYDANGEYNSRIFDSGKNDTAWNYIYWDEIKPSGSNIVLSTRSGNTSVPDASWSAWSSDLTNSQGTIISSPAGRYLQYKIDFTRASDPKLSPSVSEVGIIYDISTTENLKDVQIISDDNIWAVGSNGKIIHYDGNVWTENADMGNEEIKAISSLAHDNIWACGDSGKIYHYDGNSWTENTDTGEQNWNDIKMISSLDGWVVGTEGRILRYNGTSWDEVFVGWHELFSVYFIDAGNGWASGRNGMMYHYNGTAWSYFAKIDWRHIYDLYFIDSNNGWAVGQDGVIYKFDGSTWNLQIKTGNQDWYSVYLTDINNGWVVGNGEIYKYNNGSWENYLNIGNNILYKIKMINSEKGWSLGSDGQIRYFFQSGESGYETNSTLISSAYNMQKNSSIQIIDWDESVPVCDPACSIKLQLRSAPNEGGMPGAWTAWYGENGENTYFTNHLKTLVPAELNNNQWMQYKVELIGDGLNTPVMSEIRIDYK